MDNKVILYVDVNLMREYTLS